MAAIFAFGFAVFFGSLCLPLVCGKAARPYGKTGKVCCFPLGRAFGEIPFFQAFLLHADDHIPGCLNPGNTRFNVASA